MKHITVFGGSGSETQALRFFREILQPEYTVLITATPDDGDIERFKKEIIRHTTTEPNHNQSPP